MRAVAIGLAASLLWSLPSVAQDWSAGERRELGEGTFMVFLGERDGWRVWRGERSGGVFCQAAKSSEGQAAPDAQGPGMRISGPTPFLLLSVGDLSPRAQLRGINELGGQWRKLEDRYWTNLTAPEELLVADGTMIEVHIDSWTEPHLVRGHVSETAQLDLTGVTWALEMITECAAS